MKQFITGLRTRAWQTSGSRYNAARRLKQREALSTFSLAMLSALSVAAAVAQKIYSPTSGTPLDNYLTTVSIALGVFLLALSLLEWGAAYGSKAEALHKNAEELTAFQLKLEQVLATMGAGKTQDDAAIDALRLEYEAIKDRCSHNHTPEDHQLFMAHQRLAPEFLDQNHAPAMSRWGAWAARARWQWSTIWFFLLVWGAVLAAGGYAWRLPPA